MRAESRTRTGSEITVRDSRQYAPEFTTRTKLELTVHVKAWSGSNNFATYSLRESKWLMMFEPMFETVYTSVNTNDLEDYYYEINDSNHGKMMLEQLLRKDNIGKKWIHYFKSSHFKKSSFSQRQYSVSTQDLSAYNVASSIGEIRETCPGGKIEPSFKTVLKLSTNDTTMRSLVTCEKPTTNSKRGRNRLGGRAARSGPVPTRQFGQSCFPTSDMNM
ncbi:hypothetical protein EVAR_74640_1 [Eumeta japonica]|uniref:Uncharacterized protein n=1 Tax=Eumeta variegata TaxID=151549 RepID=A0A4C1WDD8_EUMVA|nr:hypothetical protein EVAR_74640_1 [Eumeta japonica]